MPKNVNNMMRFAKADTAHEDLADLVADDLAEVR